MQTMLALMRPQRRKRSQQSNCNSKSHSRRHVANANSPSYPCPYSVPQPRPLPPMSIALSWKWYRCCRQATRINPRCVARQQRQSCSRASPRSSAPSRPARVSPFCPICRPSATRALATSMTIICCMPPQQRWRPPSCVRTSTIWAMSMPSSLAAALGVVPYVVLWLPAWQTGARWRVVSAAGQSVCACVKCAAAFQRISLLASAHVHSQRWKPKTSIQQASRTRMGATGSRHTVTQKVFSHCITPMHTPKTFLLFWVISHLTTSRTRKMIKPKRSTQISTKY